MKTLTTMVMALLCSVVIAQTDSRYENIEKSPYLFADFVSAKALINGIPEEIELNYNGYTKSFEFAQNGKLKKLVVAPYEQIIVDDFEASSDYSDKYASEEVEFVKGFDSNRPRDLQLAVYSGEGVRVYKKFVVELSKREYTDPVKGRISKEFFVPRFHYYYITDGKTKPLNLGKKKVLAELNDKKIEQYVKKNKLKLDNESDLVNLMAYYDQMLITASEAVAAN
ncbi:MAG: hypothetical protein JXQ90_00620 [Cyclobacteriaceae bacterium]